MTFDPQKIEHTIIDPLRAFQRKVGPLNQIHNDCMQAFTTTIMGLLTGSDGATAMQGPGANALAEMVGHFLDVERQLAGTDPFSLEGRLQDASVICERRANHLQDLLDSMKLKQASASTNTTMFADISIGHANPFVGGGDDQQDEGNPDDSTPAPAELWTFNSEMQGPINEPLTDPPDINAGATNASQGGNAGFLQQLGIDDQGIENPLVDDPEIQSTGRAEVQQIRDDNNLNSNRQMGRNIAVADYEINGNTGEMKGISGPEKEGFVNAPAPGENHLTPTDSGKGYIAATDSEYKILENIADEYWSDDPNARARVTGEIRLYTERKPCPSCIKVIQQFEKLFPNIHIIVGWG